MRHRVTVPVLAVLLLLAPLSACGYSLAGRGSFLPASIRVIAVPLFTNNTTVFELERRITERVRSELAGRGKYRVESTTTAPHDAILSGVITSVNVAPSAFNSAGLATRNVVTLTANVELRGVGEGAKVIWANPAVQFREEYDVTSSAQATDPASFLGNDVNALERLATEFARSVVSAMLEAF